MSDLNYDKIEDLAKLLDQQLSNNNRTGAKWWKPKNGDNRVRVLHPWTHEGPHAGDFFRQIWQHWRVSDDQKGPVLCLKHTPHLDGECPICDFIEALKEKKNDVRASEIVKDSKAKRCFLLSVIDLDDPEYTAKDIAEFKEAKPDADKVPFEVGSPKVQVYAAPVTVFADILNLVNKNKSDITNPKTGRNLTISRKGKGLQTRYKVAPDFQETPAPEGAEPIALDTVGFVMDEGDMMELLTTGVGGEYTALLTSGSDFGALESGESDDVQSLEEKMKAAAAG